MYGWPRQNIGVRGSERVECTQMERNGKPTLQTPEKEVRVHTNTTFINKPTSDKASDHKLTIIRSLEYKLTILEITPW